MKATTLLAVLPILACAALPAQAAPVDAQASTSTSTNIASGTSSATTSTSISTSIGTSSSASTSTQHHVSTVHALAPPRPRPTSGIDPCGIVPIVYPTAGTVWSSSTHHNVTW